MYTLYTDGSAQPNPGPCGCGAVLIDHNETIVWTLSEFLGEGTNNIGELTAILRGVTRTIEIGVTNLTVYSDSELCVGLLNGEKNTKKEHLQHLLQRIHRLMEKRSTFQVKFKWIKAHNNHKWNEMADRLANVAIPAPPKAAIEPKKEVITVDDANRINLKCAFAEKDAVKNLGARWDPSKKVWWAQDTPENRTKFMKWMTSTK